MLKAITPNLHILLWKEQS
ncbi:unnamed protein product [Tuber melanosporum]|uniref:(Perigord truffle) hypothetical protein n=1 Tax=Tuber melanosporum (strain Mel28) TaxID=656061 RepID=D5GNF2_TUBMM|nr:unnamed protein product [Tuber melanosporum]